ncbi:hypothetical protein CTAYLR_007423 [Chrysophaeum taylorii]|uniref:XK-related protein n=1 Tax=Chrysophaeum taylorii TaxID=2483200 RepID=A0AAD7U563_9STRA|nr:hypothetical protein CTAYLR_007423 [Chrysophaeum taylorii]
MPPRGSLESFVDEVFAAGKREIDAYEDAVEEDSTAESVDVEVAEDEQEVTARTTGFAALDPKLAKKLCENRVFMTAALCASALPATLDVATDLWVAAEFYRAGEFAFFWASVGILSVGALASWVVGGVADRNSPYLRLALSVAHLRLSYTFVVALHEIWDATGTFRSSNIAMFIALFKLVEVVCEAMPQLCLQTYYCYRASPSPVIVASIAASLATISSGLVGMYLPWERLPVKACALGFILSLLVSRCCAWIAALVHFGVARGLLVPAAAVVVRAFVLFQFGVFGAVSAVAGRLEDALAALSCVAPFLAILALVPLGTRFNDCANPADHLPYEHGLKTLFSFAGATRGTFRNRFHSPLAVLLAMLHAAENLVVFLLVALGGPTLQLVAIGLAALALSPVFYLTAFRLVELRENRWKACLGLDASTARNMWRALPCAAPPTAPSSPHVDVDAVAHRKHAIMLALFNRKNTWWSNVFAKTSSGPSLHLVYVPRLLRRCCEAASCKHKTYDALVARLDSEIWGASDYAAELSLRACSSRARDAVGGSRRCTLVLNQLTLDDMPAVKAFLHYAIDNDDVRGFMREALDELCLEIERAGLRARPASSSSSARNQSTAHHIRRSFLWSQQDQVPPRAVSHAALAALENRRPRLAKRSKSVPRNQLYPRSRKTTTRHQERPKSAPPHFVPALAMFEQDDGMCLTNLPIEASPIRL